MKKLFGTDGIRGVTNSDPITASSVVKIAMAAAYQFRASIYANQRHPLVVIGKDTRLSGYMLEPALTAGFISMGMDVVLVGPMPTPAIAMLTPSLRANLGVMLSASHNPYLDNGIKLFGPQGHKLSDDVEAEIEANYHKGVDHELVAPELLGRAKRLDDVAGRYIEFAKNSFPETLRLDGIKVVIDCAHGAAYKVAPKVLAELGAEVVAIGVAPNGTNINENCGATSPKSMSEKVKEVGADFGIALDGDADRLILSDEKGQVIDGDQIMAMIASSWHENKALAGGGIVATVMSNMGLEKYLQGLGLNLYRAKVGDRHVVEMMRDKECNVGGEQSGHMVLSDYTTTGDGLICALQILALMVRKQKKVSQLAHCFDAFPQLLTSVPITKDADPMENGQVQDIIKKHEDVLNDNGRLLIRKSGTEPILRIMVEGADQALVKNISGALTEELAKLS